MNQLVISSPEGQQRFNPQEGIQNRYEFNEGERKFVAIGKAFGLWFEGCDIRGNASLELLEVVQEQKKRMLSRTVILKVVEKRRWIFESGRGSPYFVSGGCTRTQREHGHTYRGSIVGVAATAGVLLRDSFLNEVFGPIDRALFQVSEILRTA